MPFAYSATRVRRGDGGAASASSWGYRHTDWKELRANAQCAQVFLNSPRMAYETDGDFWRILRENSGEMRYRRRKGTYKTVVHWGQRKLLLSEIEFLTIIGREKLLRDAVVVYAGAAPGTHITYLAQLFPSVGFILVDPAPFTVKESAQIRLIHAFFTDDLARCLASELGGKKVFFVSDIRSTDPFRDGDEEAEARVCDDMKSQERWHFLLGSQRSMLKFRLPWDDGQTWYLNGDVYLPVWGPQTTTECRLITNAGRGGGGNGNNMYRRYDNRKYERQLFYFNNVTRHSLYHHEVNSEAALREGIDHCYDCKAEIEILRRYLIEIAAPAGGGGGSSSSTDGLLLPLSRVGRRREGDAPSSCGLDEQIAGISREISKCLSVYRTLGHPTPDPAERRRVIIQRQYLDGMPAYEQRWVGGGGRRRGGGSSLGPGRELTTRRRHAGLVQNNKSLIHKKKREGAHRIIAGRRCCSSADCCCWHHDEPRRFGRRRCECLLSSTNFGCRHRRR